VQLFNKLSGHTNAESKATAELVQLSGYLPLAIRLVAGRLRHSRSWRVGHLVEVLAVARDRSAAIGAVDEPISAAFDLSYNRLPDHRAQFFRRLGLHPGTDIDDCAAAALNGLDLDDARSELNALFTDHLIDEPTHGRYRFHDLVGDYARALAYTDDSKDRDIAIDRLLDYYLHTATLAGLYFERRTPTLDLSVNDLPAWIPEQATLKQAIKWLETERPTLHAAVKYAALNGRPRHAIAIPIAMHGFLLSQGHWEEAETLLQLALIAARRAADRLGEASILCDLGTVQRLRGGHLAASASQTRALDLYRNLGNHLGEANALNNLGVVQRVRGDYPASMASLNRALTLFRDMGNRLGEADTLNFLGIVYQLQGNYPAAIASGIGALALYSENGKLSGEANIYVNLGVAYQLMGDYPASMASLNRALTLFRDLGNRLGEANALNYLGVAQQLTGEYSAANASLTQALDLYRDLGNRLGEANTLNYLGVVHQKLSEYPTAIGMQRSALAMYRELANRPGEANALNCLGIMQQLTGEYSAANASLTHALDLYRDLGDRLGEASVLNNLGGLSLTSPESVEAQDRYEQALAIARDITSLLEEARALEGIGRCHLGDSWPNKSTALLRRALTIYQRLGSPDAQRIQAILTDAIFES
jgi:tetratricopeptide (TPR) repeat protein